MRPQVFCCLFLILSYALAKDLPNHRDEEEEDNFPSNHRRKHLKDEETDLDDAYNEEQGNENENENNLPVLPPIILLDFVNDNSSDSSNHNDDKPKRTIEGNLGYGFDKNSFFGGGKHNYYLPDGKTGTAVSIEESISPFAPTTQTEEVKPITEKTETEIDKEREHKKTFLEALPDPLPLHKEREPLPVYPPYPSYGQRTKLHKTSSSEDYGQPIRPTLKQFSRYTTAATPSNYQAASSNYVHSANLNGYSRPMTSSYLPDHGQESNEDLTPSQSGSPNHNDVLNIADYPKYTIENGIKYEHKIVWKYPDGRESDTPPESFSNSYSGSPGQHQNIKPESGFRPSRPFNPNAYQPYHTIPSSVHNSYSSQPQPSNIHSPKPIQFPKDAQQPSANSNQEPSEFVSASSENENENSNYYNPSNYQEQYGLRQNPKLQAYRPSGHKSQYNSYSGLQRPLYKYPGNSPSAEYSYQDNKQVGNLFTANGQLNRQVLSKYTPEAQNYLTKVFSGMMKHLHKTQYSSQPSENHVQTDYSNLLSYNPSISQYVKNPSSILNAQPTFIQAGNSLVPVIILRVDGAPPIHPKPGANINLKNLLQKYLSHYATSVTKATQPANYNIGPSFETEQAPPPSHANPVEDLRHLTETLDSLRKKGYQDPDFYRNYNPSSLPPSHLSPSTEAPPTPNYATSFNMFVHDYGKLKAQQAQVVKRPMQKIKSVQIIDDPRYTAYKIQR